MTGHDEGAQRRGYSVPVIIIAFVSGLLGLFASLALRRDTDAAAKLRNSTGLVDERFALLSLPGFSLILLGAGAFGLVAPGMGGWLGPVFGPVLAGLAIAIAMLGVYLSVLGMGKKPIPDFAKPRWMRDN